LADKQALPDTGRRHAIHLYRGAPAAAASADRIPRSYALDTDLFPACRKCAADPAPSSATSCRNSSPSSADARRKVIASQDRIHRARRRFGFVVRNPDSL
jgi:hypothetical protein